MSIKQVKLSTQAKEQLIRLKTRTGIPHWNVLCRWAFCLSLRQSLRRPPLISRRQQCRDDLAGLRRRCPRALSCAARKSAANGTGSVAQTTFWHASFDCILHRGIGYLAAPQSIRSIVDLIKLATEGTPPEP